MHGVCSSKIAHYQPCTISVSLFKDLFFRTDSNFFKVVIKMVLGKRAADSYDTLDPWQDQGTTQRHIARGVVYVMMLIIAVGNHHA